MSRCILMRGRVRVEGGGQPVLSCEQSVALFQVFLSFCV